MTAPILKWYDGATLLEQPQDLDEATPGTASTLSNFDLWNDKAGVGTDTAFNRVLEIAVRTPLTPEEIVAGTPPRPWTSAGNEATDGYWFEARINAGLGDLTLSTGPWTPLGTGRWLKLPAIPSESGVSVDIRLNTPGGPQNSSIEWSLSVVEYGARPLPIGLHESGQYGVASGIGDDTYTALHYIAGTVVENPGGVDAQVLLPDISVVAAGIPYNLIEQLVTITNTDSAAAALIAGERYRSLVYISSAGAIAQAKSVKTSGTPAAVATPAGGTPIAYVIREFDALVNNADITQAYTVGGAFFSSSGLTGSIGPYRIVNDNRLSETQTSTTVALTDAATNRIWHHPDGSLSVTTTAAKPEERAILLWEAVTAGGVVTGSTDRRLWFAQGVRIFRLDFIFDATLVVNQKQRLAYTGTRTGYILPLNGVHMHLIDNGDTSGATTVGLAIRAPGGAFTTVFTSFAGEDRRPSLAHDSTNLYDNDAFPEVLAVPPNSVLEVEILAIPGGSVPAWLNVVVFIACP